MSSRRVKEKDEEAIPDIKLKIRKAREEAFDDLLQFCMNVDPQFDKSQHLAFGFDYAKFSNDVFDEIELFRSKISKIPLLSVILLWSKDTSLDKVFGARHIMIMQELLEKELIVYRNSNGEFVKLAEFAGMGHQITLDKIRCHKEWSIDKREDYVMFYIEFANWLSETSFGFISKANDPDRACTANRWLPYNIYVTLIKELSDRERILAKLFYLGGARSLEEVLSLKIEDIDYKNAILHISEESIRYPKHVFEDIKEYIGVRKKGYVFVGRNGDRIDHTVPYRALKTVAVKLKLDPTFTFKDFVKNV